MRLTESLLRRGGSGRPPKSRPGGTLSVLNELLEKQPSVKNATTLVHSPERAPPRPGDGDILVSERDLGGGGPKSRSWLKGQGTSFVLG